ncbi:hypothetical protein AQS8620_01367 [Aquimixticola soesokkakensis]|uniref:Uncharacterized protein n=1 Tax=Aquimixticola soesokkakensis TaxID=1519096 RepID=A0A1Y5SDS8_9RHOB|nr:circularly permuted type 2 ATP-grasp protein [Aquimixticola soesokkakensis]SLN37367.1 hypothetical protein AQS8620_01367 [Aquimixticola soesokkakensis]
MSGAEKDTTTSPEARPDLSQAEAAAARLADLLTGYQPLAGVTDEMMDASGKPRALWRDFLSGFAAMTEAEREERYQRGDQYLRDAGVFFRQYGEEGGAIRDWPLSHVPVLISQSDWDDIEQGLCQRADLLEAIMADLYGAGRLASDGILPASLIAQSPEWLRPMVGYKPQSGNFLHFVAFELGRGPNGKWWVLGDRTQAPSGAGFALENRFAATRVFSEQFNRGNVHRLAEFFSAFRNTLQGLTTAEAPRVGILSPGALNDTYFEHAYIARYLGFHLLEGGDLTVENGQAMIRTVAGLKPVSVLWRRMDAGFVDPLELDGRSAIGSPGLLGALRAGNLTMINAPGAGVLETRALLAFMPRMCEALRGESLTLPNIATWWCGQKTERDFVRANAEKMMIGPSMATSLLYESDQSTFLGEKVRSGALDAVDHLLETEGAHLVGQEAVKLSTTPAVVDGKLVPRPMTLRVYMVRTAQGWKAMPGGYARIGSATDARAIGLQKGGRVADVWVVGDTPVDTKVSLAPKDEDYIRRLPGALPSRAADHLFWLGRYVERAEGAMRLMRAYHGRAQDAAEGPLLQALAEYLKGYGITDPQAGISPQLTATLGLALTNASHLRDRFSTDGWDALHDLDVLARDLTGTPAGDQTAQALGRLLRGLSGFAGLVQENMYRFTGWRFLTIGRAMERASGLAQAMAQFAGHEAGEDALDMLVEVGDSVMTHRRRYQTMTNRASVIDLLALDGLNPRSIQFQLDRVLEQVSKLYPPDAGEMNDAHRAALALQAGLAVRKVADMSSQTFAEIAQDVSDLSDTLAQLYLR